MRDDFLEDKDGCLLASDDEDPLGGASTLSPFPRYSYRGNVKTR